MGIVRVTQLDGKLPNLALMRLAAWHRHQSDEVRWERGTSRLMHEPARYDVAYGSAIFSTSTKAVAAFRSQFPEAIVGGSGGDARARVEDIVPTQFTALDYSGYPGFEASIGYSMRGCRFKCGWCVVPKQEGRARSASPIAHIWRGEGFPRHLHLLDNDFFGNPDWRTVVHAIHDGGFKVCINQGVNVRTLDDEQAEALAGLPCRDDQFKTRRIYTAWDMLGDQAVFSDGVARLVKHSVNPDSLMVYMLVGYAPKETWDDIWHRYKAMMALGVRPYPMVHDRFRETRPEHWRRLKQFQAWVIRGTHKTTPFEDFNTSHRPAPIEDGQMPLLSELVGRSALSASGIGGVDGR